MRVLWVKAGKLLPVDTGGKIRSYNLLRHLAARNEVVLLSYYGGPRDLAYEADLKAAFPRAEPMPVDLPGSGGVRGYLDYTAALLSPAPYAVTKFTSPRVRRIVADHLASGAFDVAVCDFLSASLNFPAHLQTPCVLFQHNVESVLWKRQATHEPNLLKRAAFRVEAAKMARYERATVARFPHVIAVSDRDREGMAGMTAPERLTVVPTGVDVKQYRAAAHREPAAPVAMFLGSMDWEANIDAVEYFCREIWPAVQAAVPDARFLIVGRAPHPRVERLASASVEVTGTVPSVVDYLARTAVFVVPLRVGGGTRLKIFEAMAAEKAIVSTTIGAEGLDVTDQHDVLLADTPDLFATRVVELLKDPARRRALGHAAGATAARHDWSAIARRFEDVLRQAIARTGAATDAVAGTAGHEPLVPVRSK